MPDVPKKILVATDFSATSERACSLALTLARRFSAELHFLHVNVLFEDAHLEAGHQQQLEALTRISDKAREAALSDFSGKNTDVSITPHLERGLAADEVIIGMANKISCDLIVMGSHGRRGLSHLFLGSVAEKVVRTAESPVLTVREDAAINPDGVLRFLVPHDFSPASIKAMHFSAAWAKTLGAEITLLHAVEPVVYPEFYSIDVISDDMMSRLSARSEEALRKAALDIPSEVKVNVTVEVGRAGDTIVNFAEPDRFDMIIMGTRGLSGLEHLVLGSVAEKVLRRSLAPMLTVSD